MADLAQLGSFLSVSSVRLAQNYTKVDGCSHRYLSTKSQPLLLLGPSATRLVIIQKQSLTLLNLVVIAL